MTIRCTAQEIASLALNGTPIVCVDTCSLLDLQRGLVRNGVNVHTRTQALKLVQDVEAGKVISVVTRQVEWEFNENRPLAEADAAKGLTRLVSDVARAEDVAEVFEVLTARADLSHLDNHARHARALANRWWAATRWIDERPELNVRATDRVNLAMAPAKLGKQSFKDCLIIETFFDLADEVRRAGSPSKIVFLSSNIEDYAVSKTDHSLREGLFHQFNSLNMVYATNPGQARSEMGL